MGLHRHGEYGEISGDEHYKNRMTAAAEIILHQDDASSWEALIDVPHLMHVNRATVWEEREEVANDAGSTIDEQRSKITISEKYRNDHVRSKLVALRDAVVIPEKRPQETAAEMVQALMPDTFEAQQGTGKTQ